MLVHLNHCFREIQLGLTKLFDRLSSRLSDPSISLWDTTSEHSGRKASYFWSEPVIQNWVKYAWGTVPILTSVQFVDDFCSAFNSAKPLCSCADETTVCKAWHCMCILCFCVYTSEGLTVLMLTTPIHTHTWLCDKQICHPDSSQMERTLRHHHLNHIHMLTLRHLHFCPALAHWDSPFLNRIMSLSSINDIKQPFDCTL